METMNVATEKTPKLTQKTFFANVIAMLNGETPQFTTDEMREFAEARIAKIDETNARNRTAEHKPTPKELAAQEENARLRASLVAIVREAAAPLVRDAIAEAMGITPQKVSRLAGEAANDGMIAKVEVKGEKGKRVAYAAVEAGPTAENTEE